MKVKGIMYTVNDRAAFFSESEELIYVWCDVDKIWKWGGYRPVLMLNDDFEDRLVDVGYSYHRVSVDSRKICSGAHYKEFL